jgi:uncharacterized LabA/DUF88 family protein
MRIGLDMAHLAHQGKIDRIILITADTDQLAKILHQVIGK